MYFPLFFFFFIYLRCVMSLLPLCVFAAPHVASFLFPIETPVRLVVFDRELGPAPWRIPRLEPAPAPLPLAPWSWPPLAAARRP